MQAALALVHQQRWHDQAKQDTAHERARYADPLTRRDRHASQPEQPHARRLAEQPDEECVFEDQDADRDETEPAHLSKEEANPDAEQPVDNERAKPAAQARRDGRRLLIGCGVARVAHAFQATCPIAPR